MNANKKELSSGRRSELLTTMKARFEKNMSRHKGLEWAKIQAKLEANPRALWSLSEMERTGGEPDVVGHDKKTGEYVFMIARQKVPVAAGAFATIGKRWSQGKRTSLKIAR